MLLTGSRSIRDVILFPLMRNRDQKTEDKDQEPQTTK
jgi:aspartyl-tRNA synthetase